MPLWGWAIAGLAGLKLFGDAAEQAGQGANSAGNGALKTAVAAVAVYWVATKAGVLK